MNDRIAKEKLNIFLLVDSSKSMQGNRIKQVDQAILDIKNYLEDLQVENTNVDFYLTIITFDNYASLYQNKETINIDDLKYDGIKCGGYSNLHLAYPTGNLYNDYLEKIKDTPWFKAALRYGIAIELNDNRTMKVLNDFVGNNGDVISCYNSNMLKNIIKIIVLTASKVKSTSSNVITVEHQLTQHEEVKQLIAEELADTEAWEW